MSIEKDIAIHATDGVKNVLDYVKDVKHAGEKTDLGLFLADQAADVDNVLSYAQNIEKVAFTLDGDATLLVSGVGCEPATAAISFQIDRDRYYRESRMCTRPAPLYVDKKTGEVKSKNSIECHHIIQSFPAIDGLDPRLVHRIGVEYAKRAFVGHKCVVTTHMNTEHLHNHIVVCAYSEIEPVKFHMNNASRRQIRHINDRLSVEYDLPIILDPKRYPDHSRAYSENTKAKHRQRPRRTVRFKSFDDVFKVSRYTPTGRRRSDLEMLFMVAINLILFFMDQFMDQEGAAQTPDNPIYMPYNKRIEKMERAIFILRDLGVESEWELKARLMITGKQLSHAKKELASVEESISYEEKLCDYLHHAIYAREEAMDYTFGMDDLRLHEVTEEQVFINNAKEMPMAPGMKRELYLKLEKHPEWKLKYSFDAICAPQAKEICDFLDKRSNKKPVCLLTAEEFAQYRQAKKDEVITRRKQGIKDTDLIDRNSQNDASFFKWIQSGDRDYKEKCAIDRYRNTLNALIEHGLDLNDADKHLGHLNALRVVKELLQAQISELSKDYRKMKRLESDLKLATAPQFTYGPLFSEFELRQSQKPVQEQISEPVRKPEPEPLQMPVWQPASEPELKKKGMRRNQSLDDDYLSL